jgi:hypothetical protein
MYYGIIHTATTFGDFDMDETTRRQKVRGLDKERSALVAAALRPASMTGGSVYQMARKCGNPRCRCAHGEPHLSWYLSERKGGRTRLTYVGARVPRDLAERSRRYQEYQRRLARIRAVDREVSRHLNALRDGKLVASARRARARR